MRAEFTIRGFFDVDDVVFANDLETAHNVLIGAPELWWPKPDDSAVDVEVSVWHEATP